jgi:hypothetical protein
MREVWLLPSDATLQVEPDTCFFTLINQLSDQMMYHTLVVAWRVCHAWNEATNAKPLAAIESSKRFLCSYLNTLRNVQELPAEAILKGKSVVVRSS